MKLAIVTPFPPDITGIGQYAYHVSRALYQSGQFSQIHVLAGSRTPPDANSNSLIPGLEYVWKPDQIGIGRAIISSLDRVKPDLVWINIGASVFGRSPLANLIGYMSLLHIQQSGRPTIVTMHELLELADLKTLKAPGGQLTRAGGRLLTRLATHCDVICLTMHHYTSWLSNRYPEITCVHIPMGAYFVPELLGAPGQQELLFFSTLAPYKGLDVLLSAYTALLSKHPELRLTIAGSEHPRFPGYSDSLRRQYSSYPGVSWLGQVPEDGLRSMFARAQIVILPYLASTGSSSVLHQAAAWGRPLVVSDIPETRIAVEESGLDVDFFTNRDPASLAEVTGYLLDSPRRRQQQREYNFQAIKRLRPEVICRHYLQAFNLALATRRSPNRLDISTGFPSELA
jgi:glycosyltransferase involved in cell wall biosynthesis